MRAVRFYGTQDVRIEEIEKPVPKEDEVLIKVIYAGICGSDLHIYKKGMFILNIPETMGHEFVGIVEEAGRNVSGWAKGDRAFADPMLPCLACPSCQEHSYNTCENLSFIGEASQGCFAEYICIPAHKLIHVPKQGNLRPYVLCEPLAVALHVCKKADFKREDKVLILGAGPIGLLLTYLLKNIYKVGNITVLDLSVERLKMAEAAGADICEADKENLALDYNKTVDAAGVNATLNIAVTNAKANGSVFVVSIFENQVDFPINELVAKQLMLIGCNVYERDDLEMAVNLIQNCEMSPEFVITHEFALQDAQKAFSTLSSGEKKASKVILKP